MSTPRTRLLVLAVVVCLVAASASHAQKSRKYDRLELTNLLLGPDYSQWLVGPIARIASDQERQSFLELTDDAAAEQFVERFWSSRESTRSSKSRGEARTLPSPRCPRSSAASRSTPSPSIATPPPASSPAT